MRKLLFIGALLITGSLSFGLTEELQPDSSGGNNYNGKAKLQLRVDGNAVDPVNGAWLEIVPMMSKGSNNSSLEFKFGELTPGAVATTEGSFYAEVREYSSDKRATKLKFKEIAEDENSMKDGEIFVGLQKGTLTGVTQTSEVRVAGSNQKDADITYNLMSSKGGLVGSNDRYEGYIESKINVTPNAKTGDFYDNSIFLVVKVKGITGERAGKGGTP